MHLAGGESGMTLWRGDPTRDPAWRLPDSTTWVLPGSLCGPSAQELAFFLPYLVHSWDDFTMSKKMLKAAGRWLVVPPWDFRRGQNSPAQWSWNKTHTLISVNSSRKTDFNQMPNQLLRTNLPAPLLSEVTKSGNFLSNSGWGTSLNSYFYHPPSSFNCLYFS